MLLFVFYLLALSFNVRKYESAYLSCTNCPLLIDESVEKYKSMWSKCISYIELAWKRLFEENNIFFVIIQFSFKWISAKVFKEAI